MSNHKWKIQIPNAYGEWGDLKVSIDDAPYDVELFDSKEEAQEEIDTFVRELADETQDGYRIVSEYVKPECDHYD